MATQSETDTTPPTTSNNSSDGKKEDKDSEPEKDERAFECNICLDTAHDAVVSMCGHLFCWPCLHQWLETRPNRKVCPVCKAAISKEKVIPLYGRGSTNQEDPRNKIPPRPQGQRTEAENNGIFNGFGFGDGGFQMSFGIGAFPFGFFTSTFNLGDPTRQNFGGEGPRFAEDEFLSKVFLWVALLFIFWLLIA